VIPALERDQVLSQHQHCHTHQRQGNSQLLLIHSPKPPGDILMLGPTEMHGKGSQRQVRLIDANSIPDRWLEHTRLLQPETLTGTRLGSHGYALQL
jgi:hypothetical protein